MISPTSTPLDTPFQYSVAQNSCLPYPPDWRTATNQCGFQSGGWILDGIEQGKLVSSNISTDLRAITLADADEMAVLVSPNISQSLSFTMFTFGARATCQSLNTKCGGNSSFSIIDCTPIGIPGFPPVLANNPIGGVPNSPGSGTAYLLTATCDGCQPQLPGEDTGVLSGVVGAPPPVNPIRVLTQFVWQQVSDLEWPTDHVGTYLLIMKSSPDESATILRTIQRRRSLKIAGRPCLPIVRSGSITSR